jgi:hypothetical protein
MTVKWVGYLVASIVAMIVAKILAPLVVLMAHKDGELPIWLGWFGTPDNSIDGDAGHRERWAGSSTYMRRLAWLERNSAYGFSSGVLRAKTLGPVTVRGDAAVSNIPLREGLVVRTTPEGYWQWYYVHAWTDTLCLRLNFGWKLWGDPAGATFGQFVCTPGIAVRCERPAVPL